MRTVSRSGWRSVAVAAVLIAATALAGCSSDETIEPTLTSAEAKARFDPIASTSAEALATELGSPRAKFAKGPNITGRAEGAECAYTTTTYELDRGVTTGLTWAQIRTAATTVLPDYELDDVRETTEGWSYVRGVGPDGALLYIESRDTTTVRLIVLVTDDPCDY